MTDKEKIAELEVKLSALQALYDDHECVCDECENRDERGDSSPAEAVDVWLTRATGKPRGDCYRNSPVFRRMQAAAEFGKGAP